MSLLINLLYFKVISFARLQLQMVAFGLHRAVKRCIYTSNFVDENESNDIEMNDLSHPLPPAVLFSSKFYIYINNSTII